MKFWKLCILFFWPVLLLADRITLKNGKVYNGTVESQENDIVTLITKTGEKIQVKKSEIVSMLYVEPVKPKKKPPAPKKKMELEDEEGLPELTEYINPNNKEQIPIEAPKTTEQNSTTLKPSTNTNSPTQTLQVNNTEKITERIGVDKELTNNVMQKFEDADKRREKAYDSEIGVLREELDYLKKEKERALKQNNKEEEFHKNLDKRMAGLEIRMRRLEKFLGMDENMVEYYQKERSPWDLVKRSAVFPGWGHRYAREEYTGNTYSTLFISLLVLGYFIDYQAGAVKDAVQNTFESKIVTQSLQLQSVSAVPAAASLSNSVIYSTFSSYQTGMEAANSQKTLAGNFYSAAAILYGFQIIHAYFTGVDWAKTKPRDYSNEGLLKPTGLNLNIVPDYQPVSGSIEKGSIYNIDFTVRY